MSWSIENTPWTTWMSGTIHLWIGTRFSDEKAELNEPGSETTHGCQ